MTGIVCLEIGVLADLCFRIILAYAPEPRLIIDRKVYQGILLYSLMAGSYIEVFLKHWDWYGQLACGVLGAYLLVASIQDMQSCQVYDFLHLLAAPVGLLLLLMAPAEAAGAGIQAQTTNEMLSAQAGGKILSLLVFAAIQFGIFMRMYGAADGIVFLVCAIYESRFGEGLLTYLLHMGASFLVLGVVQGFRKNINSRGNLKEPVPFVPYITATVWFFLY